jgi:nuclear pore complex protein Nup188
MYSGCSLQDFKRTRLEVREFGREYFYDIKFADKMLNSDQAWIGRKNDGLAEELAKANINLSLVDAQVVWFSKDSTLAILLIIYRLFFMDGSFLPSN